MLFSDKILSPKYNCVCREILAKIPEVQLFSQEYQLNWDPVIQNVDFKPVQYSPFWITYQEYYEEGRSEELLPFYFIFLMKKQPIAVWPLSIRKISDRYVCSFLNDDIFPPLFMKGFYHKSARKVFHKCWDILEILQKHFNFQNLKFVHNYYGPQITISEFQIFLCEKGAKINLLHGSAVNLLQSLEDIKSNVRDSYKSLINKGQRIFEYRAYNGENITREIYKEVQDLHLRMAGRVTRSQSSWDEQYNWIKDNNAFLNCSYQNGSLIGASLFPYTEDMTLYLIGVYERNLFDQPISHFLLMEAIRYFHERGVRVLYLGLCNYENDFSKPDKKSIKISDFKKGFATHTSLHIYQNISCDKYNELQ